MAWSTPLTAAANAPLTATQWNASVRDNLLETAPAKASTAGRIIVTTGANTIAERVITQATVDTVETSASTAYTDLGTNGPAVTLTTGTRSLVLINAQIANTITASSYAAFDVTGASSLSPTDLKAVIFDPPTAGGSIRGAMCDLRTNLTSGSNTFTMRYRVNGGTGTFWKRSIIVMGL